MKLFSVKKLSPENRIIAVYVCVMLVLSILFVALILPKIPKKPEESETISTSGFHNDTIDVWFNKYVYASVAGEKHLLIECPPSVIISTVLGDIEEYSTTHDAAYFYGSCGFAVLDLNAEKCYVLTYSKEQLEDFEFKHNNDISQNYSEDPDVIYLSSFDDFREEDRKELINLKFQCDTLKANEENE